MRSTPINSGFDVPKQRAAASVRLLALGSSFAASFGLLASLMAGCNELTGVNDLVIESCAPPEARGCVGPAGCEGRQLCQNDGTYPAACDCTQMGVGGPGPSGGEGGAQGGAGQGGSGAAAGQGGSAPLGQGGGALSGPGTTPPHGVCSSSAECTSGHACDGEVCRKRCDAALDCSDPGSQCAPPLMRGEPFCTANCDIFSPAEPAPGYQPCGAGVHCLPSANLRDATDCFYTRGVTRDGSPCIEDSGCLPGSICVTVSGSENGLCRRMCEPGAVCDDGTPCGAFPSPVLIAGREVGICDDRRCDPVQLTRNDARFRPCLEGAYCMPGVDQSTPSQSTCLAPAGAGALGAACTDHTDCATGLGCFSEPMGGRCAEWCRTEGDCSAGECLLVQSATGAAFQVAPGDELGMCEPAASGS